MKKFETATAISMNNPTTHNLSRIHRLTPQRKFLKALSLATFILPALHAEEVGKFKFSSDGSAITIVEYKYTSAVEAVVIPEKIANLPVKTIGNRAFGIQGMEGNEKELSSVKLPAGLEIIEPMSFFGNGKMTTIAIPPNVTTIGGKAFQSCGLTSVSLPPNLTTLGGDCFVFCKLTSIVIPPRVTTIGDFAFSSNKGLKTVTFQGAAPTLGKSVFISAAPDFTIRYFKGRSGFTTPTWQGYKTIEVDPKTELFDWVSNDGKVIKAHFVNLEGETVVIRAEDAKEYKIPLTRLSLGSGDLAKSFGGTK